MRTRRSGRLAAIQDHTVASAVARSHDRRLYSRRGLRSWRNALPDLSRRRSKLAIGLAAAVALTILSGVRALDLRSQREQLLRDGERRAANLAVVLTGYLRQTFVSVDASLRQLALVS